MADEIKVVPEGVETDDPEVARAQIAHTRARMSGTIDEIEDVLLRRKERIQHRLDPFTAVRQRPLQAAGVVFGIGLVLGLLTGGDDDEEEEDYRFGGYGYDFGDEYDLVDRAAFARSRPRGGRPRRFMQMEPETYEYDASDFEDWDDEDEVGEDEFGPFGGLRDAIADRLGPMVRRVARQLIDGNRSA